ncbi:MAG: alpha/beta hydrolase [Myxococcales bacterium]|nr:alpha/beta hydrolase [Myxococcales bacterium]
MPKVRLRRLARWLGPWTPDTRLPPGVEAEDTHVPGPPGRAPIRVRTWTGDKPLAPLLLWPGLHYAGPDDPRLDRFGRVLAHAGYRVQAPFMPDFLDLMLRPTLVDDALAVFDALVADPAAPPGKPGQLSISFGSLLALRVAAARPDQVGEVLVFGGYAEWDAAMRFSLTGGGGVPHDPLNHPVSFMNLVEHLPGAPADPAPLLAAWRQYVEATWGRPEMKAPDAWPPVVRGIAETLPAPLQPLFLRGCGLAPGALGLVEEALRRAGGRDFLDARPYLADLQTRVHLVHGMDDDVIPYTQAALLEAALPPGVHAGTHITGLYGHTGHAARGPGALFKELGAMLHILRALAGLSPA